MTTFTLAPAVAADVAAAFAADADVLVVAVWEDAYGSTCLWPQATVDNRRSRVLARIDRFGLACDPTSLVLVHRFHRS